MARVANKVSAWDVAEQRIVEIAKKGSAFVRLEDDGDLVVGAFVGEPRVRECHWTGAEYKDCDGDNCGLCREGFRLTAKIMVNFFVRDDQMMKVFEGGRAWFSNVVKVKNKYGIETRWFEIERSGAKGDPKTTYTVLPDEMFTDEDLAAIDAAKLHDLYALGSDEFPQDSGVKTEITKTIGRAKPKPERHVERPAKTETTVAKPTPTAQATISGEQAKSIIDALKLLPQEKTSEFLEDFGVRRIRDLTADRHEQAAHWLYGAAVANGGDDADVDDEDPFA